jgi:tetratricopeptide (TPR) repeat protein
MQAPVHQLYEKLDALQEKTDPVAAVKTYEAILKKDDLNINAYNRLMILYRKQKEYKKEAALIKKAIAAYGAFYKKHQPSHSKKIISLSKALAKSTGLTGRSGKALYDPEPIAGWKKRLENLKKKM